MVWARSGVEYERSDFDALAVGFWRDFFFSKMSLGPGAGPGMTINLEAGGKGSDDVEEQLRLEDAAQQAELRALLEAEMNDDDLMSDEDEEDEEQDDETSVAELQTTDDFKGQQLYDPGYHLDYNQLLQFYKDRGDELERLKLQLHETDERHHRELRAKDHRIAELENNQNTLQLDLERKQDHVDRLNADLKEYEKRDEHLQHKLEQAKLCEEEQQHNAASLQMQLQHLEEQLRESLSSDKMAFQKNEYERALHEQAQAHDRKMQSHREQINDLQQNLDNKTRSCDTLEREIAEARNDIENTRSEYGMLQDRYNRLGDEYDRFKRNTANPVPVNANLENTQNRVLNFDTTQTPKKFGGVDDGSYLIYANNTQGLDGTLQQSSEELRKALQDALNRERNLTEQHDKTLRDQERLTKDVLYWKEQVEDIRNEQSVSLRTNMSKVGELEHRLETSSKREKSAKQEILKVRDDWQRAEKQLEEKIRNACDLLHADAIQKMKDRHESEIESKLYSAELEGQERLGQAQNIIQRLQKDLNEVKETYVEVCGEKDAVLGELECLQNLRARRPAVAKNIQTEITLESFQDMQRMQAEKLKEMKNTFMAHYERQKERSRTAFQEQIEKDRARLKEFYLEQTGGRGRPHPGGSFQSHS